MILAGLMSAGACSSSDGGPGEDPDTIASRTVLVYIVAENSLSSYVREDVVEMLAGVVNMKAKDRLVLYIDDTSLPRIYTLTRDSSNVAYSSLHPEYTYTEDMNSASAETLSQVMDYVTRYHKAESYGLVFWSHGSGWVPDDVTRSAMQPKNSFGVDNGYNTNQDTGSKMNISDMASALSKYPKTEFIMFDACFMQTIETAYELRDVTEYIIGSAAEIPGDGAPYNKVCADLFADPFDPESLADTYYQHYVPKEQSGGMGVVLSVVRASELQPFASVVKSVLDIDSTANTDCSRILRYYQYASWGFDKPDFYDMKGLMQQCLTDDSYAVWEPAYQKLVITSLATPTWYSAYDKARHNIDENQYGGISMYLPLEKYNTMRGKTIYEGYYDTAWYKAIKR